MHATIDVLPGELLGAIFEERERAERCDRDAVCPRWEWEEPPHIYYIRTPTRDEFNVASVSDLLKGTGSITTALVPQQRGREYSKKHEGRHPARPSQLR
jgi:hypothetical protein